MADDAAVQTFACDSRESVGVDAPRTPGSNDPECVSNSGNDPEISSKLRHGGARENSGGPRPNSGGARPGAGRPRKPVLISYPGLRWYCVQVRPRDDLSVIHAINVLKLEPYLPTFIDGDRQVPRPLFPGYLFVRFDRDEPTWRSIHTIEGVVRVFSTGPEHPTPVRDRVIERIKSQEGADGVIDVRPARPPIITNGAGVRIVSGPFADMRAVCQHDDGTRVSLLLGQFAAAYTTERENVVEC